MKSRPRVSNWLTDLLDRWRIPAEAVLLATEFPDDCVLVSIRRDEQVLIPHGDTVFAPGDHIVAFTRSNGATQLFHCLRGNNPAEK